jgi:1-acyl-sn-glycerol-3-phosphate acyltransferase
MRALLAVLKLTIFVIGTILLFTGQFFIILFTRGKAAHVVPFLWGRFTCSLMGMKVTVCGPAPSGKIQALYVGNHISCFDIPILGGYVPDFCFIAKSEVVDWPFFGFLGGLAQTAYISRDPRQSLKVLQQLKPYFDRGQSLLLFGEGTSTDGSRVEPIKSSPLSLTAADDGVGFSRVQPFTLRLKTIDGKVPQSFDQRIIYAWPREVDTSIVTQLWRFALVSGAELDLIWHAPLEITAATGRKELAQTLHQTILSGLTHD